MLRQLSISNYAIIDSLEIELDPHLNIITGETGAGKSIILGALNMILGKRADTSVLRDADSKAIVEGVFDVKHLELQHVFEKLDLDYEHETIIRREIRPNGKSRAFVNDSPVNLDQLRSLTSQLVDLHAQQDSSSILDKKFYTSILDRLAGQHDAVVEFETAFTQYKQKKKMLEEAKVSLNSQQSDQDYIEFQFRELNELGLAVSDGQQLEEQLATIENAGQILEQLQSVTSILEDGEVNVNDMLAEVHDRLLRLSDYNQELKEVCTRLEQTAYEISDIGKTAGQIADGTEVDEARLIELRERQNAVNRLLQKHKLTNVDALMELEVELKKRLENLQISDEDLNALQQEVDTLHASLLKKANSISKKRLKMVSRFEKDVISTLHQVGMPHSRIELKHIPLEAVAMNHLGLDHFELWFSANKGVDLQSLKQVASGGERSRLMLAVKSLLAQHMQLSTMIFDEIDTGISGEVASKVGEIFKRMSGDHQIISITHLPQIAAQAHKHLFVYKDDSADITIARIKVLDQSQKKVEIAKMLSGDQPGEAALLTAKELLEGSWN